MAKVKYASDLVPLLNKHFGAVFQPNHTNQTMKSDSNGARTRWSRQTQKQQGLIKAIRQWRNMSAATKTSWNTFAATYPQASRRNPAIFLTGYQLFLKRNHYCFLNHGIDCDFMEDPTLEELQDPNITITIKSSNNSIDVTEHYIRNFGIFPKPGQFLLIRIFPMAVASGQFFEPIEQTIEVEEIFIDGFFVSFDLTGLNQNLTFSVYLSKVVHQSIQYVGTKVRYMGCFTPKTFLALTDTPDVYTGEGEKQVTVKADETGLEFTEGGGAGITCEDLPDCPTIININTQLAAISEFLSEKYDTSIPPVNYGVSYNMYSVRSTKSLFPDGWRLPTETELLVILNYLGGISVCGGPLKEAGLEYWNTPNTGATNTSKFNARGAGYVNQPSGNYIKFKEYKYLITSTIFSGSYNIMYRLLYNSAAMARLFLTARDTGSLRAINPATTLLDGETGIMIAASGKAYRTICIGGTEIMADNFAEIQFNDGTQLLHIEDPIGWAGIVVPAFCYPSYNSTNV